MLNHGTVHTTKVECQHQQNMAIIKVVIEYYEGYVHKPCSMVGLLYMSLTTPQTTQHTLPHTMVERTGHWVTGWVWVAGGVLGSNLTVRQYGGGYGVGAGWVGLGWGSFKTWGGGIQLLPLPFNVGQRTNHQMPSMSLSCLFTQYTRITPARRHPRT